MRKLILFSVIVAACLPLLAQTTVSAPEFKVLIEKKDGVILDTRSKAEFARGHIAGALLIDLQDPNFQQTLLKFAKDKPLYCYCYSGGRSRSVASFLVQNGYTKIFNLQGGIMAWTNNQFPVSTNDAAATEAQVDPLSISDYQKLIAEGGLLFIDFYAPWCAPCKQMMPMMEALKTEYRGRVKMVKANADASKELTKKLGVASVPYLILYKNGKQVFSKDQAATKDELKAVFDAHVKP